MRIAIVDDEKEIIEGIKNYICRYEREKNVEMIVSSFTNGLDFISDYAAIYDIILMDINMPMMNGMEIVRKLRKLDEQTCVIFITNLSQYAINGYEVNAFDYVLKPIVYEKFAMIMDKAVMYQRKFGQICYLLKTDTGSVKLDLSDIYYVETDKHDTVFHTAKGDYRKRISLSELETELGDHGFVRSTSSFLINLKHIDRVEKSDVYVNGTAVPLSRLRRNEFMNALTRYLGRDIL